MTQRTAIINPAEGLMIYQVDNIKGFWYFDGLQWKNIDKNNGGKQTIVLSDDITNQQASDKIAADFGPNTQEIKITGCTSLTSVDLSMITTAISIEVVDNTILQNLNLQNLVRCDGNFTVQKCPQLTNLNISSLSKMVGTFLFDNNGPSTLSLPVLTKAKTITIKNNKFISSVLLPNLISCESLSIATSPLITSFACPSLTTVGALGLNSNNNLTNVSFPLLTTAGTIGCTFNNAISTVSFPALVSLTDSLNGSQINYCPALTTISFNNLVIFKNTVFFAQGNNFNSAQVNYLLHKFATISPAVSGRVFYFDQNPTAAPPTGQGITDKSLLVSNGNTVYTD